MKRHICMEWRRPHLCNCHRAMKPKSAHCQKRNPQKTHLWAAILASFSVTGLAMRALAMANGHFGSNRNEEYILKFGPLFIWCSIWWHLRERRRQQRLREWRWWRRWSHRGFTRRWIFGLTHKYVYFRNVCRGRERMVYSCLCVWFRILLLCALDLSANNVLPNIICQTQNVILALLHDDHQDRRYTLWQIYDAKEVS